MIRLGTGRHALNPGSAGASVRWVVPPRAAPDWESRVLWTWPAPVLEEPGRGTERGRGRARPRPARDPRLRPGAVDHPAVPPGRAEPYRPLGPQARRPIIDPR